MTREEAINEINKVFEPAFANKIIIALTEGATPSDKTLEQEPILDKIRAEIENFAFDWKETESEDVSFTVVDLNDVFFVIDLYRKKQI